MKFSDETVKKVAKEIGTGLYAQHGFTTAASNLPVAKAALASLTLQDLMQVDEVRKLVKAAGWAKNAADPSMRADLHTALSSALAPFMEASND